MRKNIKLAFIGGDMRTVIAAKSSAAAGYDVFLWGTPDTGSLTEQNNTTVCEDTDDINEAVLGAKAVILPLPASLDGVNLNKRTVSDEPKTALTSVVEAMDAEGIIIGGKIPRSFADHAASKGIRVFDYFNSESFQIKNAYTTAEAALNIAMNNLKKNIRGADFAITGYGRISKQLARLLLLLGGNVTVAARKESDLTWAELMGCNTLKLSDKREDRSITGLAKGYDVIFNTVPSWLFDEEFLTVADKNTLFIELASSPGGIDVSEAKKLKMNVLWAASLPGKYAPESAGRLIYDCVSEIVRAEVKR